MAATEKVPEGWCEPIAEGMWKTDELFGIPRGANTLHVLFVALAIMRSVFWLYVAAIMHVVFGVLTQWDPEWPAVLQDLLDQPGELDP